MKRATSNPTAFRWRGGDVSRIEGFSDAVFGFAITLLVVSLEVPKSFDDLVVVIRGFGAFAVCFALLSFVWYDHYLFFRQYGLNDTITVALNLILLFIVMFYVYPLKFLFTIVVNSFTGLAAPGNAPVIQPDQYESLMLIYGTGYVAVYVVFLLLWLNAYRQRDSLQLNELERFDTLAAVGCDVILIAIGIISMVFAVFGTAPMILASGMTYWAIGPAMAIYWTLHGRRRRDLELRFVAQTQN